MKVFLLKPLICENTLPSISTLEALTRKASVYIIDPDVERDIFPSVFDMYPGHKILDEIRRKSIRVMLISKRPSYWDWIVNGEDLRKSEEKVVYVDYSTRQSPIIYSEFTPELFVMAHVGDYSFEDNRSYYLNMKDDELLKMVDETQHKTNYFSGQHIPQGVSRIPIMVMMEALYHYLNNDFHQDEKPVLLGMIEVNIYNKQGNPTWVVNMENIVLKCFVNYYGLLPNVPVDDQFSMTSTGLESTYMMCHSGQYRRIVSRTLCRVLASFVYNNNMKLTLNEVKEYGWESINTWKVAMEELIKLQ